MRRIRVEQPFALYAQCAVTYSGRAESTLEPGSYLVTHKSDGTLLIHGGTLCTPRNYQGPGAILYKEGNQLISVRKNEKIIIEVQDIHHYNELPGWSTKRTKVSKTERDLRDWVAGRLDELLGVKIVESFIEFPTPVGPVDILAIDDTQIYHVIEVKRGRANISACSQLDRYSNYFVEVRRNVRSYIASPGTSKRASEYLNAHGSLWLEVQHQ